MRSNCGFYIFVSQKTKDVFNLDQTRNLKRLCVSRWGKIVRLQ